MTNSERRTMHRIIDASVRRVPKKRLFLNLLKIALKEVFAAIGLVYTVILVLKGLGLLDG